MEPFGLQVSRCRGFKKSDVSGRAGPGQSVCGPEAERDGEKQSYEMAGGWKELLFQIAHFNLIG